MRAARIIAEGTAHYHCMSRTIEGRFIFGPKEKEYFRKLKRVFQFACILQCKGDFLQCNVGNFFSDFCAVRLADILLCMCLVRSRVKAQFFSLYAARHCF